ncbi:MAG: HD domain-containing protein [Rickettsiales bacterium]|jgi:putative hydrolase of HD superfamily|nr:HD domain-containing protein [Rickettsiales bacterium]
MEAEAKQIYDFMGVVERLALVPRDLVRGDGRNDSDTDHITKLCFLLMMILPYIKQPVDAGRVLEMALAHDLVEAEVGDTPRLQSENQAEVKARKKELELSAIEKYRDMLPRPIGKKIYDLFMEYEARETLEAKLVKAMDRFEGDMQALKENKGLRFYQNGRHEFILNYLREDLAKAEAAGEPMLAALQRVQLELAEKNIGGFKDQGLI